MCGADARVPGTWYLGRRAGPVYRVIVKQHASILKEGFLLGVSRQRKQHHTNTKDFIEHCTFLQLRAAVHVGVDGKEQFKSAL